MALALSAALFALGAWGAALALIALLDRLPPRLFSWGFSGASLLLICALVGLAGTRDQSGAAGVYAAFSCGVGVWAWQEVACSAGRRPERHGGHAVGTGVAQELTWPLLAAGVAALTWGGANQFGLWTLLALWGLHLSLRLNALCRRRAGTSGPLIHPPWFAPGLPTAQLLSLVFPLTVTLITAGAALAFDAALAPGVTPGEGAGWGLLGGTLAAGTAGHWLLAVRLPARAGASGRVTRLLHQLRTTDARGYPRITITDN
jgi:putative photosynthetic complex assembly protein 2